MTKKIPKVSPACVLCVLAFMAGGCINLGGWSQSEYEKTDELNASLAPGSTLVLDNDVGSITVEGLDVTECDVKARITAKAPSEQEARELAEKTKIELEKNGDTLTVKITKPPKKKHRSISIRFDITVPKETALQIGSDVGEIRVSNITDAIKAGTDVGEISCREISGDIDLQSEVGKINVVYSKSAPAVFNATIKTDVGAIDLTTPPDCSASVQADTDVGSITTDMPMTVEGTIGKNLQGTLGAGEGRLFLKTDVGSIRIR
jgi:hypothetical protein